MKTCPFCAEEIQDAAIVCKHCGRDLPQPAAQTAQDPVGSAPPAPAPPAPVRKTSITQRSIGVGVVLLGAVAGFSDGGIGAVFLLGWIGFAIVLNGSLIIRLGGGFILGLLLMMPFATSTDSPAGGTTVTESAPGMARPVRPVPAFDPSRSTPEPAPPPTPSPELALLSSRGYGESGFHHVEGQVQNISGRSLENVTVVATWFTDDDQFITSDEALIDFNPILAGQTSPFSSLTTTNPAMSKYTVQFKHLLGGTIATDDRR